MVRSYIERIEEIVGVVNKLNNIWWKDIDNSPNNIYPFQFRSCCDDMAVYFLGEVVWCSEEDPRNYDEKSDSYEPLEGFLRRQVRKLANTILETIAE